MYELERIGKMRKQLGLTQKELAKLSGVSQSLIAKIESGKIDPAYSKVVQIVSALENIQKKGKKTLEEVMTSQILSLSPDDNVQKAIVLMREKDVSQLPVLESESSVGSISESIIIDLVSKKGSDPRKISIRDVMSESFPVLPAGSLVDVGTELLRHYPALLLKKNGRIIGIVTKADLFKAL